MSTLDCARSYARRGWCPVPIAAREKAPRIKDWPNLCITEENASQYFNGTGNIGVILGEPSGRLVDVDLDCREAIDLAPKFLPVTNAIFGRTSKPSSHRLYRADRFAPTVKYKDPLTGKMIVELRGDGGQQTVFPGSIHESGESIRWERDGDPANIEYNALHDQVRRLAAGCLIRRYLPEVSNDNDVPAGLETADPRVAKCIRNWLVIKSAEEGRGDRLDPPPYLHNRVGRNVTELGLAALAEIAEPPTFWSEPIADGCAQMRELRDNAANQNRDGWWPCLGVLAYCEDGDSFAHEWSNKHPKYTYQETQRELDGWRRKADGPTLCDTFERKSPGICDKCPHWGKINSPIRLGVHRPNQNLALAPPPPQISSGEGNGSEKLSAETGESSANPFVSFGSFRGDELLSKAAPPRRWRVEKFVPERETTMLGGDGGTGKTTLGLQLCVAGISGGDWLGLKVNPCNWLYVSAEDPKDEIHFRLEQITRHLKVSKGELARFKLIDLAGRDATLATFDKNGLMKPTALFQEIENAARTHNAGGIIFDAVADFFGGNENERREVRGFVGLYRGLAIRLNAAVIFIAHPSVDGIKTGRGYSGSTHWNNAVRSRLYFTDAPHEEGQPPNPDLRMIELAKSNRTRRGEKIQVIWEEGRFVKVPPGGVSNLTNEMEAEEIFAEEIFLKVLTKLEKQAVHASPYPSCSYAPVMFAKQPGSKGIGKVALERAMHRLLDKGIIRDEEHGPPSKRRHRLVIDSKGQRRGDE